jgi:putative hydrolase of HD superfamily
VKKVLDLIQVLDNLSRIPRTGGVLFAGIDPNRGDSIAEHHYKVAYLSLIFGELAVQNKKEINFAKLLKTALTHDWVESILLDVPSGSPSYRSYFGKGDEFRQLMKKGENNARAAIEDYVKAEYDLKLDNNLSELEESIFNAADTTSLLIEILEWKYQGLKHEWLDYIWSNTLNRLKNILNEKLEFLISFADELDRAYQKGIKPPNPFLTKPQFQTLKK